MMAIERSKRFSKILVLGSVLAASVACSHPTRAVAEGTAPVASSPESYPPVTLESGGIHAELSSPMIADGSVARLTVKVSDQLHSVTADFEGNPIVFYPAGGGVFETFVGIPHNHEPGAAEIKIRAGEGDAHSAVVKFMIVDAKYPSEVLKVDERHLKPRKKDVIQIQHDIVEVGAIYKHVMEEKLWNGPFVMPIDSRFTSMFGTKRVFNGQLKSYHNGVDLKAAIGTPIHAAAGGVVVLAKSLFFTGNTVLIDHGYGLITLYAHMSQLKTKKGDRVKAGDLIGLSGKTGRVSGPHLHFATIIHRVKVNPLELMKLLK